MNLIDFDLSNFETLLLDRDGVINRLRPDDYVKTWAEFEFLPGVLDALAKWNACFKYIFVVTNQRGVGKGLMSDGDLLNIHENMIHVIQQHGGRIDKIYYCTALSNGDINRKPNPGMAYQIKKDYQDVDLSKTVMIGDSDSDLKFAKNAGITGLKFDING